MFHVKALSHDSSRYSRNILTAGHKLLVLFYHTLEYSYLAKSRIQTQRQQSQSAKGCSEHLQVAAADGDKRKLCHLGHGFIEESGASSSNSSPCDFGLVHPFIAAILVTFLLNAPTLVKAKGPF